MKKILLVCAIALLALATFPATADEAPQATLTADAEVTLDSLFQGEAEDAVVGNCVEEAVDAQIIPPPGWCPYGAPTCRQHDDCDAYCGDPRFGYCFSNGCCGCSG